MYIFLVYCFIPAIRSLPLVTFQIPLVLLSYFFLFLSILNRGDRHQAANFLIFTVLLAIFNYVFIYLQDYDVGSQALSTAIGVNFTFFITTFPLLIVYSGELEYVEDREAILRFVFLLVILTSITTIIGTFQYEAPCRQLAGNNNPVLNQLYTQRNIGGYRFIYFLVLACPLMMRRILNRVNFENCLVLVLSVICIIRSEYTIALLMVIAIILVCVFIKNNNATGIFLVCLVFGAFLFFYERVLMWLISQFSHSYSIVSRLEMLLTYNNTGSATGDLFVRQELYSKSWNSFVSNPLFGTLFKNGQFIGGHSEVLDFLGHSGIFGLLVFRVLYKSTRIRLTECGIKFDQYYVVLIIMALITAFLNTFYAPELVFAITVFPILMYQKNSSMEG